MSARVYVSRQRIAMSIAAFPLELIAKLAAYAVGLKGKPYTTRSHVRYACPKLGLSMTPGRGFRFDGATCAPNLRRTDGEISHAFPVHDLGWERGTWDNGTPISFDRNNHNMVVIMAQEGFPPWVLDLYERGVSLPIMRRLWRKRHGHD
jgi:hypothetical protein